MKAVCWYGKEDVRVKDVDVPSLINPRDAVVKVTSTAICGSDLHMYDGYVVGMRRGDILGHEAVGEVVAVGDGVHRLRPGDRVVVPFTISCGECWYCKHGMWSLCDDSNPRAWLTEAAYGDSCGGYFGYSQAYGGYAGGQAEYLRLPFADTTHLKVPEGVSDEQALFLSDAFPTGYQAAEQCDIQEGDTIAVWGCGPVGQFAVKSARMLGAAQVVAIDRVSERLRMAEREGGATVLDYEETDVLEALKELTGGRGPDVCIDAVGMEAHGGGLMGVYDRAKQAARLENDRPTALREAIQACRKGGMVSVPGVYSGFVDKFPMGAVFAKGLTIRAGQTNVQSYMRPLMDRIEGGEIDPSFVITHHVALERAPLAYRMFRDRSHEVVKVVLTP